MSAPGKAGRRDWLLVSDIDDTLTGDAPALDRLADALAAHRDRLWVAVNSSRPAGSVAKTLADAFPSGLVPDAVITALGTEIALGRAPLPGWADRFAGWPHRDIRAALAALGHPPHAAEFQTPRKVSFAIPRADWPRARRALAPFACRIIASGASDFDVIPEGAGKGAATLALAAALDVAQGRIAVAGDSGNDLAMFGVSKMGIAVGNARPELVGALRDGAFYHARAQHAGGVLEGLRHYGILP